jgi:hypothetical protein
MNLLVRRAALAANCPEITSASGLETATASYSAAPQVNHQAMAKVNYRAMTQVIQLVMV